MQHEALEMLFDRQITTIMERNYPEIAGMTHDAFLALVEPLRIKLSEIQTANILLPFVIVVKSSLVSPEEAMAQVEVKGKKGKVDMNPVHPEDFRPIPSISIPESPVYLISNISTGKDTLNVTPNEALKIIEQENRTPLTIDEGVALMVHFPDVILTQNAFSMLASRSADKKVPAMWISYGNPRLGWCWAGNPHTWLGSASAEKRIG